MRETDPNVLRVVACAAPALILVVVIGCASPESASEPVVQPPEARDVDPAYQAAIDQALSKLVRIRQEGGPAGLSVALSVAGDLVWSEGLGFADLENQVAMSGRTKMRVGSVAKPITAVALAELMEQGKVDWDAEIQTYLPDFPRKRWPITVRQVATHTAGVRHYRGTEFLMAKHFETVSDALGVFSADPLLFEPSTRYSYSSYGYNLLSGVAEEAAGEPFLTLMDDLVFSPLGLADTMADQNFEIITQRTEFYDATDGRLANAPYVDNSVKWAGGGFLSTAEDLARFGSALLEGELLERDTLEAMWTPAVLSSGEPTTYGLGWMRWDFSSPEDPPNWSTDFMDRQTVAQVRLVGHTGGSVGGITAFVVAPDHGVVAVAISNTSGIDDLGAKLLYVAADLAADVALAKP